MQCVSKNISRLSVRTQNGTKIGVVLRRGNRKSRHEYCRRHQLHQIGSRQFGLRDCLHRRRKTSGISLYDLSRRATQAEKEIPWQWPAVVKTVQKQNSSSIIRANTCIAPHFRRGHVFGSSFDAADVTQHLYNGISMTGHAREWNDNWNMQQATLHGFYS